MKFRNHDILQTYKECAGKDCSRQGFHYLRINFINKYGWFCDSCRDSLIDDMLAADVSDNVINRGICK